MSDGKYEVLCCPHCGDGNKLSELVDEVTFRGGGEFEISVICALCRKRFYVKEPVIHPVCKEGA